MQLEKVQGTLLTKKGIGKDMLNKFESPMEKNTLNMKKRISMNYEKVPPMDS